MGGAGKPRVGSIAWIDLTVEAARDLRDFYQDVAGWTAGDVDMGGYSDFTMHPPGGGDPIAGVCHATKRHASPHAAPRTKPLRRRGGPMARPTERPA